MWVEEGDGRAREEKESKVKLATLVEGDPKAPLFNS